MDASLYSDSKVEAARRRMGRQAPGDASVVRVQRMTRKWGSCSTAGTVTLAIDLDDESSSFQDFVIAHELLHLKVRNHGKLFKALLTAHVPGWRRHDVYRRTAGKFVPSKTRAITRRFAA